MTPPHLLNESELDFELSMILPATGRVEIDADKRRAELCALIQQQKRLHGEWLIGDYMTMEAALESQSHAGAGYTIGVNSLKAEQHQRNQEGK